MLRFEMSSIKGLGKSVGPFLVLSHTNGNCHWAAAKQTNKNIDARQEDTIRSREIGKPTHPVGVLTSLL